MFTSTAADWFQVIKMTWWGLAIGVTGNYAKNWNLDTLKTELLGQSIWLWINWPTCKVAVRMTLLATWLMRWNMHSKWFKIEKGITCRTRLGFLSIQEVCYWKETGHHKHSISKKGDSAFQLAASLIKCHTTKMPE